MMYLGMEALRKFIRSSHATHLGPASSNRIGKLSELASLPAAFPHGYFVPLTISLETALAWLVEARAPLPGAGETASPSTLRIQTGDQEKGVVWFGLDDSRPLFCFADIWTEFKGHRGTKSRTVPGPHLVYGFLTTAPKRRCQSS
jgi:hypothetical protein